MNNRYVPVFEVFFLHAMNSLSYQQQSVFLNIKYIIAKKSFLSFCFKGTVSQKCVPDMYTAIKSSIRYQLVYKCHHLLLEFLRGHKIVLIRDFQILQKRHTEQIIFCTNTGFNSMMFIRYF
jgi:hypothetical protein